MSERITNIQMKDFLKDFEQNSKTEILEEGKEMNEIVAIAKAKGINLKNNKDLSGFKTIYTFANKANKNKARLPKEILLKALPTMIGKPVDIDHNRSYVVGHYIDYRYRAKEDMVIAFGVYYKSNFGEEWEEAKKLFKSGKLTSSYEIWCDEDKRNYLEDGTYELLEQEIAGGALLYKETPAFSGAKVLELAKKNLDKQPKDLIFASKYKSEDLITSADDIVKPAQPQVIEKVKCSNCEEVINPNGLAETKCPKCFAIIDKQGQMIYPPQIRDFKVSCPACSMSNWRTLERTDVEAKLKCLSCARDYKVLFAKKKINELANKMEFIYLSRINCLQCGKAIEVSGCSSLKIKPLKCKRCGLEFTHDITHTNHKQLSHIEEVKIDKVVKSSEKGGTEKTELKVEATIPDDCGESKEAEVAKGLEDNEKSSKEKMEKKIEKVEEKKEVEQKIDETVKEQPKAKDTPSKVEETPKAEEAPKTEEKVEKAEEIKEDPKVEEKKVEAPVEPKLEEKPTEVKIEKVEEPKVEEAKETKEQKYAKGIHKMASQIRELKKKVKLYESKAKTIVERRIALGQDAEKLSDEDIVNDDKFERAKVEKENKALQAKIEKSSVDDDVVGSKDIDDSWKATREQIDKQAFGR